ncbi:MAG: aldehyde dehydrogenase family protein [Gammaproteobacteria bacterium]|nr:aldehyde dehydrogenase family protein [Gammaproteobacteria bacterium]
MIPEPLTPELSERIERVFDAQKATAQALKTSTIDFRLTKLKRLRREILERREAIVAAAQKDFNRPEVETDFTEMMPVLMEISDYCRHLKKWMKPRRVRPTLPMLGTQAWTRYEPRGRCLILAPWNYPLTLTLGPLVPAVACGNTAMIKTSEVAPHFSAVLVEIVEAVFDEEEVAIFEGDANVASALLNLPFDHCFFTGSPAIGKVVMGAAAKHLTSVTLELGGKSPVVVDETADIKLAAKTIAWAKYINTGQTCIAPDHIYVHEAVQEQFIRLFCEHLREWYGEGDKGLQAPLSRSINSRHAARVAGLLEDAVNRGARVLFGGHVDIDNCFVSPTLLTDIPADAEVMREEIFGALLPIIPFGSLDNVIESINSGPKPLAFYIWSNSSANADQLIAATSSGGVCINHVAAHFLHHNLPFGGVNNSGIGSYHGEWGVRAFSHERAVLKTRVMTIRMLFPPYTDRVSRLLKRMLRFI